MKPRLTSKDFILIGFILTLLSRVKAISGSVYHEGRNETEWSSGNLAADPELQCSGMDSREEFWSVLAKQSESHDCPFSASGQSVWTCEFSNGQYYLVPEQPDRSECVLPYWETAEHLIRNKTSLQGVIQYIESHLDNEFKQQSSILGGSLIQTKNLLSFCSSNFSVKPTDLDKSFFSSLMNVMNVAFSDSVSWLEIPPELRSSVLQNISQTLSSWLLLDPKNYQFILENVSTATLVPSKATQSQSKWTFPENCPTCQGTHVSVDLEEFPIKSAMFTLFTNQEVIESIFTTELQRYEIVSPIVKTIYKGINPASDPPKVDFFFKKFADEMSDNLACLWWDEENGEFSTDICTIVKYDKDFIKCQSEAQGIFVLVNQLTTSWEGSFSAFYFNYFIISLSLIILTFTMVKVIMKKRLEPKFVRLLVISALSTVLQLNICFLISKVVLHLSYLDYYKPISEAVFGFTGLTIYMMMLTLALNMVFFTSGVFLDRFSVMINCGCTSLATFTAINIGVPIALSALTCSLTPNGLHDFIYFMLPPRFVGGNEIDLLSYATKTITVSVLIGLGSSCLIILVMVVGLAINVCCFSHRIFTVPVYARIAFGLKWTSLVLPLQLAILVLFIASQRADDPLSGYSFALPWIILLQALVIFWLLLLDKRSWLRDWCLKRFNKQSSHSEKKSTKKSMANRWKKPEGDPAKADGHSSSLQRQSDGRIIIKFDKQPEHVMRTAAAPESSQPPPEVSKLVTGFIGPKYPEVGKRKTKVDQQQRHHHHHHHQRRHEIQVAEERFIENSELQTTSTAVNVDKESSSSSINKAFSSYARDRRQELSNSRTTSSPDSDPDKAVTTENPVQEQIRVVRNPYKVYD